MNKKLKYLAVGLFLTFISCGTMLKAADVPRKIVNTYESQAVYSSSQTCSYALQFPSISVTGTLLLGVDITSAGTGSPIVQLFNSNNSTFVVNTAIDSPIDSRTIGWHTFNYFASSGVTVSNGGISPACITIYYQDKH